MRQCIGLAATVLALVVLVCGCASTPKRDLTRLQGTWVGQEIGGPPGECRMTIEGRTIKFQGTRSQEWYVGTITLNPKAHPKQATILIADCGYRQYAGKTAKAIYKLEGDKLTLAGHEPGKDTFPTKLTRDPVDQTRAFTFTRQSAWYCPNQLSDRNVGAP
jgi:uncharacterized protein (TIGR03067 family)